MIPRKKLDIGWMDLVAGVFFSLWPGDRRRAQRAAEEAFLPGGQCLASLSERSAFDVAIEAYNFPPGSEILISALTVKPFPEIVKDHGLVPIPIDLDMSTLGMRMEILEQAVNEKTRAIVCAQLIGSRIPLDDYLAFARKHNLVVFEDCAQAFTGDDFRGTPEADVSMFSFGPIKTASALWGGITRFKDREILARAAAIQERQPVQGRMKMLARVLKYFILRMGCYRGPYTVSNRLMRWFGVEDWANKSIRNFTGNNQMFQFRHQPSYPILKLMERRLKRYVPKRVKERTAHAEYFNSLTPDLVRPACDAPYHSYWIYPILVKNRRACIEYLWSKGFDSTVGPSSFLVADAEPGYEAFQPHTAKNTMNQVIYICVHDRMTRRELERLAQALNEYDGVYRKSDVPEFSEPAVAGLEVASQSS